jgi:hypothetical protein
MDSEFDFKNWGGITVELQKKYPELTNADLIWRHETKDDLFKAIANKIGKTKNELVAVIDSFEDHF